MTINQINSQVGAKHATITLDYDEIRDISNMMCEYKVNGKLRADMFLLFEIVKNGCLDRFSLEHAIEIRDNKTDNNNENE